MSVYHSKCNFNILQATFSLFSTEPNISHRMWSIHFVSGHYNSYSFCSLEVSFTNFFYALLLNSVVVMDTHMEISVERKIFI